MATLAASCLQCRNKGIGVFKCQGCSNVFCRQHASEHRIQLSQQLDEITHEYNEISQFINDDNNQKSHPLIEQINQWENKSIFKIQQIAKDIRNEMMQYIKSQQETRKETLKYLSQRFRKAQEDDDYIENDLQYWSTKLENLRKESTTMTSSLILSEDLKTPLIYKLYFSNSKQQNSSSEIFSRSIGDIVLDDNGQLAIHGSQKRSDAFLCGQNQYTKGQHKIRFVITKTNPDYITTFGIASMQSQFSVFGWSTDDQSVGSHCSQSENKTNQHDMKGETILQIEFLIDCEKRKISYFNERTRCSKEMSVNLDLCPLPWQLYFYLYDVGEHVRLLPLHRI